MSFPKDDRNIQSKSGKTFPARDGRAPASFSGAIASALREEFGRSPSAAKRVARLAQANERAARNWIEGTNGPSGDHLMALMRHSNLVFRAVLTLADRPYSLVASDLREIQRRLLDTAAAIDDLPISK